MNTDELTPPFDLPLIQEKQSACPDLAKLREKDRVVLNHINSGDKIWLFVPGRKQGMKKYVPTRAYTYPSYDGGTTRI